MSDPPPTLLIPTPLQRFTALEYPGSISTLPASLAIALNNLGGLDAITQSLNGNKNPISLNLSKNNLFSHPIDGQTVQTGNILLKISKRTKTGTNGGVYIMEWIGVVDKTVRFRAMADFQMEIPSADRIVQASQAVRNMDVEKILNFKFDPPTEDFDSIQLIPPPMFSAISVPHIYNYKQSAQTTFIHNAVDKDGKTYSRSVHKKPSTIYSPISISIESKTVPLGPAADILAARKNSTRVIEKAVVEIELRLKKLFSERPMWTRIALLNQLSAEEARVVNNQRQSLAMSCYTWSDGPFTKLLCRFGWDPRKDRIARQLQHLVLRNLDNSRQPPAAAAMAAEPAAMDKGKGKAVESLIDLKKSHIFDGITVHREIGNFQLIDITDPILVNFIQNEKMYFDVPTKRDGYWIPELFDIFRRMVKFKFTGMWKGNVVNDIYMEDLISELEAKIAEIDRNGTSTASQADNQVEHEEDDDEDYAQEGAGEGTGEGTGEESDSGASSQGSTISNKGKGKAEEKSKPRPVVKIKAPWVVPPKQKNRPKPKAVSGEARAQALRNAIGLNGTPSESQSRPQTPSGLASDEEEEAKSTDED